MGIRSDWFLPVAGEVFQRLLILKKRRASLVKGCYVCVVESGEVSLMLGLGDILIKKSREFSGQSLEGALRLLDHPGHVSSWLTRDLGSNKRGGAITAPPGSLGIPQGKITVVSISSDLGEFENEAAALVIALAYRWIVQADIGIFIAISGNFMEKCGDLYE
ncbi:MAG: hypothetical protein NT093_03465 [Candidatus Moranbacteria bacterium]|nr:hypothetical protein [Candidatus Moranbacteria bacterium]